MFLISSVLVSGWRNRPQLVDNEQCAILYLNKDGGAPIRCAAEGSQIKQMIFAKHSPVLDNSERIAEAVC